MSRRITMKVRDLNVNFLEGAVHTVLTPTLKPFRAAERNNPKILRGGRWWLSEIPVGCVPVGPEIYVRGHRGIELIDEYGITVEYCGADDWKARVDVEEFNPDAFGATAREAAMRALLIYLVGPEVEI